MTSCPRQGLCLRKLCARLRISAPTPAPGAASCALCRMPQCLCRDDSVPVLICRSSVCWCRSRPRDCTHLCRQASEWRECASVAGFPDSAFALAARLLEPDPWRRPSAAQALAHPFLAAPQP